jgi:hypothetical protein
MCIGCHLHIVNDLSEVHAKMSKATKCCDTPPRRRAERKGSKNKHTNREQIMYKNLEHPVEFEKAQNILNTLYLK